MINIDKKELFKKVIEWENYSLLLNLSMRGEPRPVERPAYVEIDNFKYMPINRVLDINSGNQIITLRCISDLSKKDISIIIDDNKYVEVGDLQ